MVERARRQRRRRSLLEIPEEVIQAIEQDPWRQDWLRLTPGERLVRAWRLRDRLKDPQAIHDAKTLPRV